MGASDSQARLDAVWKGSGSMFEFNRQSRNFQHSRFLVSILGMMSPAKTFEFKPGFPASLIQRGTKLSLSSLQQQIITLSERCASQTGGLTFVFHGYRTGTTAFEQNLQIHLVFLRDRQRRPETVPETIVKYAETQRP